jgi:Ca2+-transporting ATPase
MSQDEAEAGLTYVGLVGLLDPPRPDVKAALATSHSAGIRTVMVTGDHPLTAQTIAEQIGLDGNTRVLFANLKKGVRYYLACKVALVSAVLLPVLLGVPVPFAPIQIIVIELFMDVAASVTFANEPAETDVMHKPPRNPRTRFLDGPMVRSIFSAAAGVFAAVSVAYLVTWYSSGGDLVRAQTVAFVAWLLGHVLLAINLRSEREPLFRLGFFSNRLMIVWAVAAITFVLFATLAPFVQNLLKMTALSGQDWLLVLIVTVMGTFWIEMRKVLFWRGHFHQTIPTRSEPAAVSK